MATSVGNRLSQALGCNQILADVPRSEMALLDLELEHVDLPVGSVLARAHQPVDFLYFLNRGVATLTTRSGGEAPIAVALTGPEGVVGVPLLLGSQRMAAWSAEVAIAGQGARIAAHSLRQVLADCPTLHNLLLRYALALMSQITRNVACLQSHTVDQRLARLLLSIQDCVPIPSFIVTQDRLADMLGARRPTVSLAASELARRKIVSYTRGHVRIVDQPALHRCSCHCYDAICEDLALLRPGEETERKASPTRRQSLPASLRHQVGRGARQHGHQ